MPLPRGMRKINKRFTNRIMGLLAGKKDSFIALVKHVGRHSGRFYQTPILAEPSGKGFVFALTYGKDVDWYQNVVAADGCVLVWHGKEYSLAHPHQIEPSEGLSYYRGFKASILKKLKINDFTELKTLHSEEIN